MAANGSYPMSHGAASVAIETRGGVPLVAFGKEGDDGDRWDGNATSPPFEIALWEDHVAPTLETSLFVESWCVCNFDRDVADRRAFCANETASEYLCGPEGCICDTHAPDNDDAYCCEKSACDGEHRVQQIERLDWHGRVVANLTYWQAKKYGQDPEHWRTDAHCEHALLNLAQVHAVQREKVGLEPLGV